MAGVFILRTKCMHTYWKLNVTLSKMQPFCPTKKKCLICTGCSLSLYTSVLLLHVFPKTNNITVFERDKKYFYFIH
jgi:hypothetical protein